MGSSATKIKMIDNLNNVNGTDLLAAYKMADKDETDPNNQYYGFLDSDGNWYITHLTPVLQEFIRGILNYSTNWTNRASLVYVKFDQLF